MVAVVTAALTSTPLSLGNETLDELAARGLPVPTYDRSTLKPSIVHIGVGGFHRAHLAVYCHQLAGAGSTWGIRGLGVLPGDAAMAEALAAQDHLYTFSQKDGGEPVSEVIGSIIDFRHVADDWDLGVATLADPEAAIISLTITEAGYVDPESGTATVFDMLAEALDARRVAGNPVTVLSCDNLPGNGDVAKAATLRATERFDADHPDAGLSEWVTEACTFPNSMVDRITPMTADADRHHLEERWGLIDRWPVVAEPFTQWVVEDNFAAGRPDFGSIDILFSDDVHAWELYKLRMLNAGHSTMAYLSALADIVYVDEAMATPTIAAFLDGFLYGESVPTLTEIPGHPREDYVATVLGRFTNLGVRDQIARLCIDGSAKFPTFLLPTIAANLATDGPIDLSTLALAGWARYLAVTPEADMAFDASGDAARAHGAAAAADPLAFLDYHEVFGAELRDNARFRATFAAAYARIVEVGPLAAIESVLESGL